MAKRLEIKAGDKFGHLTYIRDAKINVLPSGQKPRTARCKCDCGKIKNVLLLHLVRGRTVSCGCKRYVKTRISVVGKQYGSLVVVKELKDKTVNGRVFRMVEAVCKCGKKGQWRLNNLRQLKSCGCLVAKNITHGLMGHPLYSHWNNMKNRCYNKNTDSYNYCGGKGVVVCEEWRNNFKSFFDWSINNGWEESLTLDRFPDIHGNYEPLNCRWANFKQQANNKTTNVLYSYKGEIKTLAEFAAQYGFNYKKVHTRIKYLKWSIQRAIET